MSKVATYLQEHIQGEVTTNNSVLDAMSRDNGVLSLKPEMVIYPKVTNDIRKVTRFASQLAEKGHVLPLTVRGGGTDVTGAAIGSGASLVLTAHMNQIFELAAKQKLVRVQPGARATSLNAALMMQGMAVPAFPLQTSHATVGGLVANNSASRLSGKYGTAVDWVHQLEVVLSNGDVLQTGRLSKRELSKKKGQQNFEGEVYRAVDALIEDNRQLIDEKLTNGSFGNTGYASIANVKQKDGSFDLAPLFVGSQGTLGVISEMILKTEFLSAQTDALLAVVESEENFDQALSVLGGQSPSILECYSSELFKLAAAQGKQYDFYKARGDKIYAVILAVFDDFSDRARSKSLKKSVKLLERLNIECSIAQGEDAISLSSVQEVTTFAARPTGEFTSPPIAEGIHIPSENLGSFIAAVRELGKRYQIQLPFSGSISQEIYSLYPLLQLRKVGDRQKIFKLIDEVNVLATKHSGVNIGCDGEGRLKSRFVNASLDPELRELFKAVKTIFDPLGILNPGVKQDVEVRQLAAMLRTDYGTSVPSDFVIER